MAKTKRTKRVVQARREQAEVRAAVRAKRTDEEQINILDSRPGNSKKERRRLGFE